MYTTPAYSEQHCFDVSQNGCACAAGNSPTSGGNPGAYSCVRDSGGNSPIPFGMGPSEDPSRAMTAIPDNQDGLCILVGFTETKRR
jgi:hypothetical protein